MQESREEIVRFWTGDCVAKVTKADGGGTRVLVSVSGQVGNVNDGFKSGELQLDSLENLARLISKLTSIHHHIAHELGLTE